MQFIPTDVNPAIMATEHVQVTGVGSYTIPCPSNKRLCCWITWVGTNGTPDDNDTQNLLKFGSRKVLKMGALGNALIGTVGPLVGNQGEDIVLENEDGGAGVVIICTITYALIS